MARPEAHADTHTSRNVAASRTAEALHLADPAFQRGILHRPGVSAWDFDVGTTPCCIDSQRDNTLGELSKPVQPGDVDTVSPRGAC